MPRRKPLPPDTRPDWRDPNCPCIRDYRFADGRRLTQVDPDYERRYRKHLLNDSIQPHYSFDPTYNLRKDRR